MTSDFHSLAGIPLEQTKNLHCPPISCYDHRFGKSDLTPPAPKKNCHGQENELSSYRVVERVVQDFGWTHRKSDEFRTETRKKSLWRDGVCWKRRRMLGFFQVTRQKNLFFLFEMALTRCLWETSQVARNSGRWCENAFSAKNDENGEKDSF